MTLGIDESKFDFQGYYRADAYSENDSSGFWKYIFSGLAAPFFGTAQGFVAQRLAEDGSRSLVISFRGTEPPQGLSTETLNTFVDILNDLTLPQKQIELFDPLIQQAISYAKSNNIEKIYFTGHSLGGAVAEYAMRRYGDTTPNLEFEAVVFGSPGTPLTVGFDPHVLSFAHTDDIVAAIDPIDGTDALRLPIYLGTDSTNWFTEHSMGVYLRSIQLITLSELFQYFTTAHTLTRLPDELGSLTLNTQSFVVGAGAKDTVYGSSYDDLIDGGFGQDSLYGNSGNDRINGGVENDILFGGNDNDTLQGGRGNDTIDGGTNNVTGDLAIFDYSRSYYSVTTSNGITTVRLLRGDDTDTITNVEYFQFGNEKFDLNHVNDVQNQTLVPLLEEVITPTIINQAPIITGISSVSKSTNQSFGFTSLINASDPDGTVAYYKFSDTNPGAGYLTQNNVRISGTSVTVSAANLGQIGYFTDSTAGSNQIAIEAIDNLGKVSPNYLLMTINVGSTNVPPPPPPVATSLPVIYMADFSLTEGDTGTRNGQARVYLNQTSNTNVSFKYMVISSDSEGWAKFGSDYELQAGTLTIAAGATSGNISIPVIGDTKVEGDEKLTVILSDANGAVFSGGLPLYTINGKIHDDDAPSEPEPAPTPAPPPGPIYLDLNADDAGLLEGTDGIVTEFGFDILRTGDLSVATKYRWEVQSYGADPASATDFVGGVLPSGTGTFSIGDSKETFTVQVKGDLINEPNEAFLVKLYAVSSGVQVTDATETGTIRNDDGSTPQPSAGAVYVSIRPYDAIKSEGTASSGDTPFVFELTRDGDLGQETQVTVRISTPGTTPQASTMSGDFQGTGYTSTFAIGENKTYVTFNARPDSVNEPDEPFSVKLSQKSGYENVEFIDRTALGMILNDDGPAPPLVTAPSIAIHETDSNQTAMLRVQLSAATTAVVSMDYEVYVYASSSVPSTTGTDFSPVTGTITVQSGNSYVDIPITILGDNLVEGIEVVDVRLSNLVNGYFGRSISSWDTSVVILDDDGGVDWPGDTNLSSAEYIDLGLVTPYSVQNVSYWLDETVTHQIFKFEVDEPLSIRAIPFKPPSFIFSPDGQLIESNVNSVDGIEVVDIDGGLAEGAVFQPGVYYIIQQNPGFLRDSYQFEFSGIPAADQLPLLTFNHLKTSPGGLDTGIEGQGVFWAVELSQATERDVTFDIEIRDLSATNSNDVVNYEQSSWITIPAGEISSSASFLKLLQDTEFEGDEYFELVVKNVSGAILPNKQSEMSSIFTIIDDDPSPVPVFVIKALSANRAEGSITNGKFIFEV